MEKIKIVLLILFLLPLQVEGLILTCDWYFPEQLLFRPNTKHFFTLTIKNDKLSQTLVKIDVVSEGIKAYVDPAELRLEPLGSAQVNLHIEFGQTLAQGLYTVEIVAYEDSPKEGAGMISLTSVQKNLYIINPYETGYAHITPYLRKKYLEGSNIDLKLKVRNIGREEIRKLFAIAEFYYSGVLQGTSKTEVTGTPPLSSNTIHLSWKPETIRAGEYLAKILVNSDGTRQEFERKFLVGNPNFEIGLPDRFSGGQYSEIPVEIGFGWNVDVPARVSLFIIDRINMRALFRDAVQFQLVPGKNEIIFKGDVQIAPPSEYTAIIILDIPTFEPFIIETPVTVWSSKETQMPVPASQAKRSEAKFDDAKLTKGPQACPISQNYHMKYFLTGILLGLMINIFMLSFYKFLKK